MHTKTKAQRYIDPEGFYVARHRAGLTMQLAADELGVDERTIRNWERGRSRIPYSAFRLLRLLAGYQLIGKEWNDWSIGQGKLWTPEGRSFAPHELRYVATYISIARASLPHSQARATPSALALKTVTPETPVNATAAGGEPSSATALFGYEVRQVEVVRIEWPLVYMEKAA